MSDFNPAQAWPSQQSRSAALFERAKKVLPGGNTRTTVFHAPFPVYAAFAEGAWVTDVDGVKRLDTVNNYTALIHGHRHPAIMAAVQDQLTRLISIGQPTEDEIAHAELLQARVPSFERVRYMNSGTEAVMTGIRATRAFTGRTRIAKCEGAYHGSYDWAEVGQSTPPEQWTANRPLSTRYVKGTPQSVLDEVLVLPFNRTEQAAGILAENGEELAAIVVDPMPMRAGLAPAKRDFLEMLRAFCDRTGTLLVFDEVISFRLGYHGAQGEIGVTPDLTTLGKIIGGGFPVGAIAGRADVMDVFNPISGSPAYAHGGTFNANPVTMAAGMAAMNLLTPDVFATLTARGDHVRQAIDGIFARKGHPGCATGAGSLIKVHFHSGPIDDYRSAYAQGESKSALTRLLPALMKRGVMATPVGLVSLSTVMTDGDVAFLIDALEGAISEAIG